MRMREILALLQAVFQRENKRWTALLRVPVFWDPIYRSEPRTFPLTWFPIRCIIQT